MITIELKRLYSLANMYRTFDDFENEIGKKFLDIPTTVDKTGIISVNIFREDLIFCPKCSNKDVVPINYCPKCKKSFK